MRKLVERCPACGGELAVVRMSCTRCPTELSGRFATTVFDRLSPESLAFVETFVRLRGNIKEMERDLGVPYNAVRNRLDEVIRELGFERGSRAQEERRGEGETSHGGRKREILAQLERGEIDPGQAITALEALKQGGES